MINPNEPDFQNKLSEVRQMLTPRELLQTDFRQAFRGYNEKDVDAFVSKVVKAYESLAKENKALSDQIEELQEALREDERAAESRANLMRVAEEAAAKVKEGADEQAQALIREAEDYAAQIAEEARRREAAIQARVDNLRKEEERLKEALRTLLGDMLDVLDQFDEDQQGAFEAAVTADPPADETQAGEDVIIDVSAD